MVFDWQDVVALTIVFAAAVSLVHRAWRTMVARRSATGCTRCSGCSSGGGQKELVSVSLGTEESTFRRSR